MRLKLTKNFPACLQASLPNIKVISEDAFDFEKIDTCWFQSRLYHQFSATVILSKTKPYTLSPKYAGRLNNNGKIIILFHAFWLIPFSEKQLKSCRIHRFNTFPPYFLLIFTNKAQ